MAISIPLSKTGKNAGKYVALIDDCDADLAEMNWCARKDRDVVYPRRTINKTRTEYLHKVIAIRMFGEIPENKLVDHIDNNPLNCCRDNLRLASYAENAHNVRRHKDNQSGYKGVSWNKNAQKWMAQICFDNRKIHLGLFDTSEKAHKAWRTKALELQGEFFNDGTSSAVSQEAPENKKLGH